MYFHISTLETLIVLFILLDLGLCYHMGNGGGVVCEGGRREGDKWFDGCQWCVCEAEGPVCSPRDCSEHVAHVPPCENLGSRWRDGCYHCTCGISGIECKAEAACVSLMRSEPRDEHGFLSRGKCMEPMDYRCICGVDGVPSCSAEVIDRTAYTSTLITMNLTHPGTLNLASSYRRDNSRSTRRLESGGSKRRHRGLRGEYDLDRPMGDESFDMILTRTRRRARSYRHHHRQTFEESNSVDYPLGTYGGYGELEDSAVDSYRRGANGDQKKGRKHVKRHYEEEEEGYSDTGSSPEYTVGGGTHHPIHAPPSLLVATDNRCRFGARWYGGSLRCFCDVSGSITCGEPSFVAMRIDGFTVDDKLCEEGHAWEEEKTCRSCECHYSTLVVCRRSLLCPLPFLIRPSPDSHERGHDLDLTWEFRGGEEHEIHWSGKDKEDRGHGKGGHKKHGDEYIDIEIDDSDDIPDIILDGSGGHSRPVDSGEVPHKRGGKSHNGRKDDEVITITEGGSKDDENIIIDLDIDGTSMPPLVIETDDDDVEIDLEDSGNDQYHHNHKHGEKRRHHTKNPDEDISVIIDEDGIPDSRYTTVVTVRECKPGSRWWDGCLRCHCSLKGRKRCDDSKCPKFDKPAVPVYPQSSPDKDRDDDKRYNRPMQRPPPLRGIVRYTPIAPPSNLRLPCGKFRVGQKYWKHCNLCVCTPRGPRCTAKSCG